ncbi:MAG TPA: hypothetical protein O0X70_00310 [Methanocorpusculum sp.]|nr:hypothetical protein [Methanocorpusculum sp.]
MNQQPSSKKWIVFLVILVAAAVVVASVAAVTIGSGELNPMKLTEPEYPGVITDNPGVPTVERPVVEPDTPICLYGCPNPTELSGVTLTKETEILAYD